MITVLCAALALVLGIALGAGAMLTARRSVAREAAVVQVAPTVPVVVDPQVEQVVDLLRSAGLLVGPHDEVLHGNPQARQLGVCRGDRIQIPAILDAVRIVRRTERPTVFDTTVPRGVGAPVLHLNVRISPLDKDVLLVLVEDRSALVRVDETRRDFVANVGHELKTPIGAIQLLSEAVEQAADDPDAVAHFATRMHRESRRLGELVTQIIDLSRLQSDDPMLRAEPLLVTELVDEAVGRSRELAERREVVLVRAGETDLGVLGDRSQLVDAVANLVQNALVYSDPRTRVVVSTTRVRDAGEDFVEISVADNGIGISVENQQRIFERFYRVDYSRSRENGGTGLGLSIVKHIAAVHGGQVNVWSKLGQGSTFTIRLPEHVITEPAGAEAPQNIDERQS